MATSPTDTIERTLRVPPHSTEAERGVLGSILIDTASQDMRVLDLCSETGITADAFYTPANKILFETILEMSHASSAIDAVTLTERLRSLNCLDAIGGTAYIQTLIDETPTSAHAEYYINIVRQKALLRTLINRARETEQRCYADAGNADVLLGEIEQSFLDIADHRDGTGVTWPQAVKNTIDYIERIFKEGTTKGIPTGFMDLDKMLKGLQDGDMIVLAARPSMGKTSLAMNIAECVALGEDINGAPFKGEHGRPHAVAMFSLEMSTESLALRMLCGRAHVSAHSIEKGFVAKSTVSNALFRAAGQLNKAKLYIDDTGGLDIMDLRARARRMKKRFGIELIVIDYLQLCNCREFAKQGRQIETSQISAQIKSMAKELKVPVIVLSQLSRAATQRSDKTERPKLSDLRDSGAIEQDADVVLLLRRPCKVNGDPQKEILDLAIVDIAKHRNGPTGEVNMNFEGEYTRFGNRAQEENLGTPVMGSDASGGDIAEL